MKKEKNNYKFIGRRVFVGLIVLAVIFGAIKIFSSASKKQSNTTSEMISQQEEKTQKIKEQEEKIKELEEKLKNEQSKNIEGNFVEFLSGKFEGNYISSTIAEDNFVFDIEFLEDLKAEMKVKCKYEAMNEDIMISKIAYPRQKMKIVDQNAKQGYVVLEGVEFTTPKAYNDKEEEIASENVEFSLLSDREIQTFDMKVWIKDNELSGFLFDKEGREFARVSAQKIVENTVTTENK